MPSLTTDLSQGILSIRADSGANRVQVLPANQNIQVLESDQVVGTFDASQVQLIAFRYGAGQSSFDNETPLPVKELRLSDSAPSPRTASSSSPRMPASTWARSTAASTSF